MESNVIQLLNANKAIFIAVNNHWTKPVFSVSVCSNKSQGYFQEKYSLESDDFNNEKKRLKRILADTRLIITDSDTTKDFLIKQFKLQNCVYIPIFSIATEILPEYIFRLYVPKSVKDLFYLFFCDASFEENKTKENRTHMTYIVNDLLFYKYLSDCIPITHKSELLEKLAKEINQPNSFATINFFKTDKNTYDKESFFGTRFIGNEYSYEIRKHFDDDESYFRKLSVIFSDVKYIITYDGNAETEYLKNLYAKFNTECNFEIIDLKVIAETILQKTQPSLDLLMQRFVLGYDYDYDFRYVDQSIDLYELLVHMINEYAEVKDILSDE